MSSSVETNVSGGRLARRRPARGLLAASACALVLAALWPATDAGAADPAGGPRYGLGRAVTAEQIAPWDIDVRPDGHGVRKGRGSVTDGQALYDVKCASCHGTFGESNNYIVLAGGVDKEALKSGRAASLRAGEVRTVGNKLNYATTLWDYINRAMPWNTPQSLTVDQVYAVTAYVLYLNEIVPEDFVLDDKSLLEVKMPNRNGYTRAHGMGSVKGKPDVQGSACMKDCPADLKVTSVLPEFARNQHGNLAEQRRAVGGTRGLDTLAYDHAQPTARRAAAAPAVPEPKELLTRNACTACHGTQNAVVGPAFSDIADKYRARNDAMDYLTRKIRSGGTGTWGPASMPPQPALKDDELATLARWILSVTR